MIFPVSKEYINFLVLPVARMSHHKLSKRHFAGIIFYKKKITLRSRSLGSKGGETPAEPDRNPNPGFSIHH